MTQEKEDTLSLLAQIKQGKFAGYISEVVLREIQRATDTKQKQLLEVLKSQPLQSLGVNEEVDLLAGKYLDEGIIPERYRDDALHIALASVYNLDVLVSWNFEHLVKVKTRREVQGINTLRGYRSIDIAMPTEVIER